jgi:hypothetical protein
VARVIAIRATGLAYNLANALRQLALPRSIRSWNLTTLCIRTFWQLLFWA